MHTCPPDPCWQGSPSCSQGSCAHNLQTLTVAGNQDPYMESPRDGVVNVLLTPQQQQPVQNLRTTYSFDVSVAAVDLIPQPCCQSQR